MSTSPRRGISPWWWVLCVAGGALFLVGTIAWLGGQASPTGRPWLRDPDAIILALIGGLTSIMALLVPNLAKIRASTAATENHVVNSHSERIMRDDLDEIKDIVKAVRAEQREQRQDIQGLRAEIGQLRQSERDQWAAIEKTGGRKEEP